MPNPAAWSRWRAIRNERGVQIKTGDMMFWWAPGGRSWADGWAWVEGEGVVVLLVLHSKPIQSTPPGIYTEADSSAGDETRGEKREARSEKKRASGVRSARAANSGSTAIK